MWVGFNGFKAESYLKYANITQENPTFVYDKDRALEECMSNMIAACKYKKSNEIRLKGLIHIFLSELIDNSNINGVEQKYPKDIYIRKAVEYITNNYARNITVRDIADYLCISRNYFCSIFKKAIGKPSQEYLIQYRMDKACEYMYNNDLSISDISHSVGYEDPFTFSKVFKKTKGLSPKQYRQCQQKSIEPKEAQK
jgi:YesN/AraC family two-component response regulator